MTLWYGFAPPEQNTGIMVPAASQLRWMAALLLLLVIIHVVTEIDRNQHNRDDHAEQWNHFKVWHDTTPLRFCRASEVKSQAPSYSFLLSGALKGVFKDSMGIITYTDRCVNFQFESYNWNVLPCVDISNAHRKRKRSVWTKNYKCNREKARIYKLGRPLIGAAKSLTHHPRHMARTQSF